MTQHKFTVTAARGMLPLLADELKQLGIRQTKQEQGSVRFSGTLEDAYRVCLWSRIAIRVLMPIAHMNADSPEALYQGVLALPWEDHIEAQDSTLAVDCNSFRSKIQHSQYGAQKVKDAIVDRLRAKFGQRPSVDLVQPDLRINVYIRHNQAIVSIDLSGDSLHKRGYRVSNTAAPLKENLAAAILLSADWPRLASQGWGLVDPMCGSGTFLIEAAMMAADIAPGILRDYYGFSYWKQHDKAVWQKLFAEAERRRHSGLARMPVITGGDIDPEAVAATKANLAELGLQERVQVYKRRLLDWSAHAKQLPGAGLLVCNPPYGERLGVRDELYHLYESLGNLVNEDLTGWRSAVITDNPQLGKHTGLTLFDQIPFDNGPIACEVLFYRAPKPVAFEQKVVQPDSKVSQSIWPQVDSNSDAIPVAEIELSEQGEMFANRLRKNLKNIGKWARKNNITCYRLYDADLPDYAVAIDIYNDYAHVQEYAPPKSIDPMKALARLEEVMHVIPDVLDITKDHVVLKLRQKQRGSQQYTRQAQQQQRIKVQENELQFWINLTDYLDTGLFLDHRKTRQMLAEKAYNRDFLNLFCYTGSATVYAAAGHARSTTSVDMSNTYLNWAQENMQLNNFVGGQHQFIRANCLEWLQTAQQASQHYGLIFLDPPTFSNSSKMEGVFDIQRDHVALLQLCANLLTDDGILLFSTNRRDFKLDNTGLEKMSVNDISRATLPKDFERNSKIHYCWQISKN